MAETTAIEWAHATFNPWIGCTKVSPGCTHCYAESDMDHRRGRVKWGKGQPRSRTSAEYWKGPLRWNRAAIESGERRRVFCASLADVFDDEVPIDWLADLMNLIAATPGLDWLLLTKRPQNISARLEAAHRQIEGLKDDEPWHDDAPCCAGSSMLNDWCAGDAPANVWLGTTVEDQARADERIPHLIETPARVRFLSCEPMVGPVDLRKWLNVCPVNRTTFLAATGDTVSHGWGWDRNNMRGTLWQGAGVDWVICGGESGHQARPMNPDWSRLLRDQCAAAGVAFLFKQWGEWGPTQDDDTPFGEFHGTAAPSWVESCMCDEGTGGNLYRVGKKTAGRVLDGLTHDGFPVPA